MPGIIGREMLSKDGMKDGIGGVEGGTSVIIEDRILIRIIDFFLSLYSLVVRFFLGFV